jgi:hypothetical protein
VFWLIRGLICARETGAADESKAGVPEIVVERCNTVYVEEINLRRDSWAALLLCVLFKKKPAADLV